MLPRDDLAALATSVYGSGWQSVLARERGVAVRTVQRWAKDGIGKPETALAIRAYLLTRRVIDIPPPQSDDDEERDDAANSIMLVALALLIDSGAKVGWHPAELSAGALCAAVDALVDGAGAPATIKTMHLIIKQLEARIEH